MIGQLATVFVLVRMYELCSGGKKSLSWTWRQHATNATPPGLVHHCHLPSKQRRRGRSRPVDREHSHTADATGGHAGVMGSGRALWVAEREALGTGVVERGGVDITGQSLGKQWSITTHLWTGKKITSALIHKCKMIFIAFMHSVLNNWRNISYRNPVGWLPWVFTEAEQEV